MISKVFRKTLLLGFLLALCCCAQTTIHGGLLDPQVAKLVNLNQHRLGLRVLLANDLTGKNRTNGHQFVFLFLPLGKVVIEHPDNALFTELYSALTLRGYKVVPALQTQVNSPNFPVLEVTLEQLTLSAYDLFFTRRLACSLTLNAKLWREDGAQLIGSTSINESKYRSLGFRPQLEGLLRHSFDQGISDLFVKLGL